MTSHARTRRFPHNWPVNSRTLTVSSACVKIPISILHPTDFCFRDIGNFSGVVSETRVDGASSSLGPLYEGLLLILHIFGVSPTKANETRRLYVVTQSSRLSDLPYRHQRSVALRRILRGVLQRLISLSFAGVPIILFEFPSTVLFKRREWVVGNMELETYA